MLGIIGVRGIGQGGKNGSDEECKYVLIASVRMVEPQIADTAAPQHAYLQHRSCKRSIWCAYPQDIHQAAGGKRTHALVLVGEEVLAGELLRNLRQRVLVGILLLHIPQLNGERIQPPQQLAGRNRLPRAP